jgi:hypothetical protein
MAMDHAKAVMAMELNPEHKNFARLMSAKQSVLASVFTATARVRDGLLRPSNDDGLDDILARIKGGEAPVPGGDGIVEMLESDGSAAVVEKAVVDALVTADDLFN